MHLKRWASVFLFVIFLALPAFSAPSLTPESAPQQFFNAVDKMDYARAWKSFTQKSQTTIIEMVVEMEGKKDLTPATVKALFDSNNKALQRGFWTEFRKSVGISDWRKQTFVLEKQISPSEALVKAKPSGVVLKVKKEGEEWRLGYIETFMTKKSGAAH